MLIRGHRARGGPVPTKTCENCGQEFAKDPDWNLAHWASRRFCSARCRGNGRPQTILTCDTCGEQFVKRQYSYPSRRYYCSRGCYYISLRTDRYPVRDRRLGQEFSAATKRRAMEAAGGRCQQCGAKEHLEFDHIVPCHLGGSCDEGNCQVLCRTCHRAKTTAEIRRANNPDQEGLLP
jgi:5-methylcytosine-specific restriction endonuclease McrA